MSTSTWSGPNPEFSDPALPDARPEPPDKYSLQNIQHGSNIQAFHMQICFTMFYDYNIVDIITKYSQNIGTNVILGATHFVRFVYSCIGSVWLLSIAVHSQSLFTHSSQPSIPYHTPPPSATKHTCRYSLLEDRPTLPTKLFKNAPKAPWDFDRPIVDQYRR